MNEKINTRSKLFSKTNSGRFVNVKKTLNESLKKNNRQFYDRHLFVTLLCDRIAVLFSGVCFKITKLLQIRWDSKSTSGVNSAHTCTIPDLLYED